jgi:DNA mismatch endonuclease (patch repair protein)
MARRSASFVGLRPASETTSKVARSSSKKRGTRCEIALRKELRRRGIKYSLRPSDLPGKPDLIFTKQRLLVFCDGDFWHGRNLKARIAKLKRGHNAKYWVAKVKGNVLRDRRRTAALKKAGWRVIRLWETDILRDAERAADRIESVLNE